MKQGGHYYVHEIHTFIAAGLGKKGELSKAWKRGVFSTLKRDQKRGFVIIQHVNQCTNLYQRVEIIERT